VSHDESLLVRLRAAARAQAGVTPLPNGPSSLIVRIAAARRRMLRLLDGFTDPSHRLVERERKRIQPSKGAEGTVSTTLGDNSDHAGFASVDEAERPDIDPEPVVTNGAGVDETAAPASAEATSADPPPEGRRPRARRRRGKRRTLPEPPAATWVMVAPGRFIRVEQPPSSRIETEAESESGPDPDREGAESPPDPPPGSPPDGGTEDGNEGPAGA
jgi:hypothetical protein